MPITRPRRVFPLQQASDDLGQRAITSNPAPNPKPPASPKPKVAKPKVAPKPKVDPYYAALAEATPDLTSEQRTSMISGNRKPGLGELRESEKALTPALASGIREYSKSKVQTPKTPTTWAQEAKGALYGLERGLPDLSYPNPEKLDAKGDIATYEPRTATERTNFAPKETRDTTGYSMGRGAASIVEPLAYSSVLGPVAGTGLAMGRQSLDAAVESQEQRGIKDPVELIKETAKGTAKGIAFGKVSQNPVVEKITSAISGGVGSGLTRAIGAAVARPVLTGTENVLTSVPIDIGVDIASDIATGDNSLARNQYITDPGSSIKRDLFLGGGLGTGFQAAKGIASARRGGIQEGLRTLGTGIPYEPAAPQLQRRSELNFFGDQSPDSREQNISRTTSTPIFEPQVGESLSFNSRPSTPQQIGETTRAYNEPRELTIPLKAANQLQQPPIRPTVTQMFGERPTSRPGEPVRPQEPIVDETVPPTDQFLRPSRLDQIRALPDSPNRVRDFGRNPDDPMSFNRLSREPIGDEFDQELLRGNTAPLGQRPGTAPLGYDTIIDTDPNSRMNILKQREQNRLMGIPDSYDTIIDSNPNSRINQARRSQEMADQEINDAAMNVIRNEENRRNPSGDANSRLSPEEFIQEEVNRTNGLRSEFPPNEVGYQPGFDALRQRMQEQGYAPARTSELADAFGNALGDPQRPARRPRQEQLSFMNEQAAEPLAPRTVQETAVEQENAREYAEPILNNAIRDSYPSSTIENIPPSPEPVSNVPARKSPIPANKAVRLSDAEARAVLVARGIEPTPEAIAAMRKNARRLKPRSAELVRNMRNPKPEEVASPVEAELTPTPTPTPAPSPMPPSFTEQVRAGNPRLGENAAINVAAFTPKGKAPKAQGQALGKRVPGEYPRAVDPAAFRGEAVPSPQGYSIGQQGSPSLSPGQRPGTIKPTPKPVASEPVPTPTKSTSTNRVALPAVDRAQLSLPGRAKADAAKAKLDKEMAYLDEQAKQEGIAYQSSKDRRTLDTRLEQIAQDRKVVEDNYNQEISQIKEKYPLKRAVAKSEVAPKPKDIQREQDAAEVAEQRQRKEFTEYTGKEQVRLSNRVKDLEARVARNQAEQAKLKPNQRDRAKDLKEQADDLNDQLAFAKRQEELVANMGKVMAQYDNLPASIKSSIKPNYDLALKELADIAPKAKVVEGANVLYKGQAGKVIATQGSNASVEIDGQVVNVPKKDLDAYHENPSDALPKEVTKVGEMYNRVTEASEAKKTAFAKVLKQIVSPGKKGQAGNIFALPQNLPKVKDLVNSAKAMLGNIKGFNTTKAAEFLAGDKGVLESVASAINMARIGLPHQRFKDAFATASDQLHSNMLINPVASMIDRLVTRLVGGERSFTTGSAKDYASNLGTVVDAGKGFLKSQRALLSDKWVSPEAKQLYEEYSLKGLFAKTTLTNPISRSLGEVDLAMKQGIRKRVTQEQIYLKAINEYGANKANISAPRKTFIRDRVKQLSNDLAKYEAGQGLPKSDWETIQEIKMRAEEKAIEGVFAQDNTLSDTLEAFQGKLRSFGEAKGKRAANAAEVGVFLAKVLMPFVKVKTNVARKMALNLPPVALGDAIFSAISKDKAAFSQAMARTGVNSALMAIGWQIASTIAPMTRFGTKEPDERKTAALNETAGRGSQDIIVSKLADPIREAIKEATGVEIPGVDASVKATWAGGITTLIAFGAMMRQKAEADRIDQNDDRPLDIDEMLSGSRFGEATLQSIVMLAQEHPAFATVGRTLSGIEKKGAVQRVAANLISDIPSGLPGLNPLLLAGRVASQNNPFDTSARVKEDPARDFRQGIKDNIREELPGNLFGYGREALPERTDSFGRPVSRVPMMALNPFGIKSSRSSEPLIDTMTNVQGGPSPIDRTKDEDLGSYLERRKIQGGGAYEAAYEFLERADPETRLELMQGLTKAMGEGKELAMKDKPIRIKSRNILKGVRKKQEKEGLR